MVDSVPNPDSHSAHGAQVLLREDEHLGRVIRIRTTYEITVNGVPFHGHMLLDNDGNVYSHACPYSEFPSAMGLIKHLIELYPDDFSDYKLYRATTGPHADGFPRPDQSDEYGTGGNL